MFIKRQQHPSIEFIPADGQQEPHLVHYFSDRGDPFKSVLPELMAGADQDEERVFMVESPLSELVNWTIDLNRHQDFLDRVLVDERHRAFFDAVKASLTRAIAQIDGIEYAQLDETDEDG